MGTVLKTQIEWRDNVPHVVGKEAFTKVSLSAMAVAAVSLPYKPVTFINDDGEEQVDPEELEFEGLSNGEVMLIRQARNAALGDYDSTVMLLDRICGKPKQQIDSTTMTLTLQDYLAGLPAPPVVTDVTNLLDLKPEDGSQRHAIRLKVAQMQDLIDDL
jgi:hypothetical protein